MLGKQGVAYVFMGNYLGARPNDHVHRTVPLTSPGFVRRITFQEDCPGAKGAGRCNLALMSRRKTPYSATG
jgi:hypothetical protein